MQLRTFLAKDMKEALATVRADMGPEAVIIASEKAKSGGVLVRAALDTREEEAVVEAASAETPIADFEAHYRDGLLRRLRSDAPKSRLSFDRTALITALNRHRLPEGLAHALAESAAKAQLTDMTLALASALDKKLRTYPIDFDAAGALLLVGPNGAGKTAVAAKIAAHARLAGRRTTLIATDSSGAGAVARLETFARHLDCAVATAESTAELASLVSECLSKKTFVIVDTAGFDPRDGKARAAFAALAQTPKIEAVGVVSVLSDAEEASEIVEALASLGARRLIATGADLARRAGALTAAATASIPLAHITRSPFVAGGLEAPTSLSLARLLLDEQRSAQ
ncbi:MAG TPA: AAA family ATPase [Rhizomicrobium sp.]|jgi:flagellar biosynthesis protein FlhF|nr:AAA family ATPase [Rhizomicrobium sp.]